jgi:bacteriorhodopsin
MLFMLVESRGPFNDGEQDRTSREPWLVALLAWFLPWPALIVWLCAASRVLEGWLAFACVYTAILICAWRGLKALPTDGLNQTRQ